MELGIGLGLGLLAIHLEDLEPSFLRVPERSSRVSEAELRALLTLSPGELVALKVQHHSV